MRVHGKGFARIMVLALTFILVAGMMAPGFTVARAAGLEDGDMTAGIEDAQPGDTAGDGSGQDEPGIGSGTELPGDIVAVVTYAAHIKPVVELLGEGNVEVSGNKITLKSDVSVQSGISITGETEIDFNGHVVSYAGQSRASGAFVSVASGGTLTLSGTGSLAAQSGVSSVLEIASGGTAVLSGNVSIKPGAGMAGVMAYGTFDMRAGSIVPPAGQASTGVVASGSGAKFAMSGGTLTAHVDGSGNPANLSVQGGASVELAQGIVIQGYNDVQTSASSIRVRVQWLDGGESTRPANVGLTLERQASGGTKESVGTMQANKSNNWQVLWDAMPDKDASGKAYAYGVAADDLANSGYSRSVSALTNGEIVVTYTHTSYLAGQTVELPIEIKWSDNNNYTGVRPAQVVVTIYQNGVAYKDVTVFATGSWVHTETDLPKYDANGRAYAYQVMEKAVPDGYVASVAGYVITNRLASTGSTVSFTVSAIWVDDNDANGMRPKNVIVRILQNGKVYDMAYLTASGQWQQEFSDLPAEDASGRKYTYTIDEPDVPDGYESAVTGYTVVNTLTEAASQDIRVTVAWDDANDRDGVRPQYVAITLYQNGVPYGLVTVDAASGWQYLFEKLPVKDKNGKAYTYTIDEQIVPDGYTATVSGFMVTNRHVPGSTATTGITFAAAWDDANDAAGRRPSAVTIAVYNGNMFVRNVVLTEQGGWYETVDDLPVYNADGTLANYTAQQGLDGAPAGYTARSSGYTVTFAYEGQGTLSTPSSISGSGTGTGVRPEGTGSVQASTGDTPQTGDGFSVMARLATMVICMAAAAFLLWREYEQRPMWWERA